MIISLKPEHLKRYRDILRLLVRHGRYELVRHAGIEEELPPEAAPGEAGAADELASELERMGPTFIKLGQILSTRADLLPVAYLEALSRLQDRVEPFPFEEAERIVTSELGVRLARAFTSFDPVPLAAASLAQVHRATLPDGRPVAVKVQRPGVREQVAEDFEALLRVAELLDRHTAMGRRYGFRALLDEFRKSLMRELDFRREAHNLVTLAGNLAEFDRIIVPSPVDDCTTARVLTMDYIRGEKITKLTPLARVGIGGEGLAEQLFRAYLRQLVVDGFLHADPHPGNVFLTGDGRVALLDLGMVLRLTPGLQERLLQLLMAISEGRGEDAAEYAVEIGEPMEEFDRPAFERRVRELVAQQQGVRVGEMQIGRVVLSVARAAADCAIRIPAELAVVGQTLLKLDQVGRILYPEFDPNAAIRRNAIDISARRVLKSATRGNVLNVLLEMRDFLERLPARANRILEAIARNELKLTVDTIDETRLMEGVQKIANRITLGLVLAALIVGAALLMRVETAFRILGYPALAIVLFLAAAIGGIGLVIEILLHDVRHRRKRPGR